MLAALGLLAWVTWLICPAANMTKRMYTVVNTAPLVVYNLFDAVQT